MNNYLLNYISIDYFWVKIYILFYQECISIQLV